MKNSASVILVIITMVMMFFSINAMGGNENNDNGNGNNGFSKDCYTINVVSLPTDSDTIAIAGITIELSDKRSCDQNLKSVEIRLVQGEFESFVSAPEGWLNSSQMSDTSVFGWGYCAEDSIHSNNGPDESVMFYFEVKVNLAFKEKAKISIKLHTQQTINLDVIYHSREEIFDLYAQPALPIELISFEKEDGYLLWTTATETNNDFFIIEKSTDGLNWVEIGEVSGAGTSSQSTSYEFYDENAGLVYYRLSQVDYDGTKETFPIISDSGDNSTIIDAQVTIFPNPTSDFLNVATNGFVKMNLFNESGQLVLISTETKMDIQDVVPGIYVVEVQTTSSSVSQTIIIN